MSEEIIKIIEDNFEASAEVYMNFEKVIEKRQSDILIKIHQILKDETQSWEIELGSHKGSNCLFINKENIQIRYWIKSSKHSVINIEGINKLNDDLKREGFKNLNTDYYWIQKDYHMDLNELIDQKYKEVEIIKLLKNIINSFNK